MAKKRRAANGDGSIYQTKSGQWKAALTVRSLDGSRRRVTRNAKSRRHGREVLDRMHREFRHPTPGKSSIVVADLLSSWLKLPNRRDGTIDGYERSIRNHITPSLGGVNIQNLTPLVVSDWVVGLSDQGVGARSQEVAFSVLSMAFGHAIKLGLVESNPCTHVSRPKSDPADPDPFTVDEMQLILKETRGHRLGAIFQVTLTTGLRVGEVFGLQWSDIDFEDRTLSVIRQCVEHRGKVRIDFLKTKRSRRTVTLTTTTLKSLEERRIASLKEGHASRDDHVFLSPNGKLLRQSNFRNRVWNPLLSRLNLRHRGFHQCRHTAATTMLRRKTPIHVVSRILGHARVSITLDIYAHFVPSDAGEAADAMSDLGVFG